MNHKWIEKGKFLLLDGNPNRCVWTLDMGKGYLFVFGRKCSYAKTIAEAKDYVEAFAELGRWP